MKYNTLTEEVFRKRPDGLYQQVIHRILVVTKPNGEKERRIDSVDYGGIYRVAVRNEHSIHGEAMWNDNGVPVRLIRLVIPE